MSEVPHPLPEFVTGPTFPFEGDLRVKKLDDPVFPEPPRDGDNPAECRACTAPDEAYIWVSDRWRVRSLEQPSGLPAVLILESRSHLDLGDLPNMLAAELGVMTVRLERAVRSLDGVARVHVNRWGDGAAHLHLWFLARPYGQLQLRGSSLSMWDEILPPITEHQWRENLALVAAWLADFDGHALAEPPRIDWKSPATLAPVASSLLSEDAADAADAVEIVETADPSPPTIPDEFVAAREVRVVPGPSGYSPIGAKPVQGGEAGQNPVQSVPGQREGFVHDRDPSAPAPA